MNVDFGELQETCQKTDGLVDCKHMFQKTTSFLMDSCDLVKGRFTESTYLIIAIFSLGISVSKSYSQFINYLLFISSHTTAFFHCPFGISYLQKTFNFEEVSKSSDYKGTKI